MVSACHPCLHGRGWRRFWGRSAREISRKVVEMGQLHRPVTVCYTEMTTFRRYSGLFRLETPEMCYTLPLYTDFGVCYTFPVPSTKGDAVGHDFGTLSHAMTKQDYDREEQAGHITRPITDRGMKVGPGRYNSAPDTPTKGNEKTDRRVS